MNIIQARGTITDAKDHQGLLEAMRTARAPAYWPRYTPDEQQELCGLVIARSRKLAEQMRTAISDDEKAVEDAVRRMANPNTLHL